MILLNWIGIEQRWSQVERRNGSMNGCRVYEEGHSEESKDLVDSVIFVLIFGVIDFLHQSNVYTMSLRISSRFWHFSYLAFCHSMVSPSSLPQPLHCRISPQLHQVYNHHSYTDDCLYDGHHHSHYNHLM